MQGENIKKEKAEEGDLELEINTKALDLASKISEKQKSATTEEDWEEIAKLFRDVEKLYTKEENKERELEILSPGVSVVTTNEFEKYGLKVGQKLKLRELTGNKSIDEAKEILVVGFDVDGNVVTQFDKKLLSHDPLEIYQTYFEPIKEKERQMEFILLSGDKIYVTDELEKNGWCVGQKVKEQENHAKFKTTKNVKDIKIVGFNESGDVITQLDGDRVTVFSADFFNEYFELTEDKNVLGLTVGQKVRIKEGKKPGFIENGKGDITISSIRNDGNIFVSDFNQGQIFEFTKELFEEYLEPIREIKDANSFDELYKILEEKGYIEGSKQKHKSEDLIDTIKKFVDGKGHVKDITRSEGLRDKVIDLAKKIFP